MIYCELIHHESGCIYAADHEVLPDSMEEMLFQKIGDPAILGYTYICTYEDRIKSLTPEPFTDGEGAA